MDTLMKDGFINIEPIKGKTIKEQYGLHADLKAIQFLQKWARTPITTIPCNRCGVKAENIRMYDGKCEICFHLDLN